MGEPIYTAEEQEAILYYRAELAESREDERWDDADAACAELRTIGAGACRRSWRRKAAAEHKRGLTDAAGMVKDRLAFEEGVLALNPDDERQNGVALACESLLAAIRRAAEGNDMERIEAIAAIQTPWSNATFGTPEQRGPIGPLEHLREEAREAQANPADVEEFADCLLLVLDAARRAGHSLDDLLYAAREKAIKNTKRTWSKPEHDAPVHHVHPGGQGNG